MFSDHIITLALRSITITPHDLFMAAFSIVSGLIFWALLYFTRKRIVVVKRSSGTDQLTYELSRIADTLEGVRIVPRTAPPRHIRLSATFPFELSADIGREAI